VALKDGGDDAERAFREALRDEEIRRTRQVIPATLLLVLIVPPFLPLLRGDSIAKGFALVGFGLMAASLVALRWLAARPERFLEGRVGVCYTVATCGGFLVNAYAGIFSAATAMVPGGIFFISMGRSGAVSLVTYLINALGHGVLAALIIAGWMTDRGLMPSATLDSVGRLVFEAAIQAVFLQAFLIARSSRRQLDRAVAEHAAATHTIARRDALLAQARNELERALRLGGAGRFTGERVGSFTLGVVIGRGAMGEVYEAIGGDGGARAAVKLLNLRALGDSAQVTRFLREAEVVRTLDSPHVVRLLEVARPGDPLPYLAMERLDGHDLARHLRESRVLTVERVVELVRQVADGLAAARRAGIVHRDVKPQNLFRAEAPGGAATWKILDFGVSQLADQTETITGVVLGTPMYMAPEQARGGAVDHRADVYALATVAYRALTGHPPFAGKDASAILYAVLHRMPAQPSGMGPLLPEQIDDVLMIGMAKAAADRFATAEELAQALALAAEGRLPAELCERARRLEDLHPWTMRAYRSRPPAAS
jgi:serine/threonine-protein kinase